MFEARFQIDGVVKERRELKSQKNKDWRGYRVRVATLGAMLELTINDKQYRDVGVGEHMVFTGEIQQQGDYQSLVVASMKPGGDKPTGKAA